jgi:hypothetical protein
MFKSVLKQITEFIHEGCLVHKALLRSFPIVIPLCHSNFFSTRALLQATQGGEKANTSLKWGLRNQLCYLRLTSYPRSVYGTQCR